MTDEETTVSQPFLTLHVPLTFLLQSGFHVDLVSPETGMAAHTVHGYPGGRLTRSKAKAMSTSSEPSSTRTSPKSKTQSPFTGKGKILSEASDLPFPSELSKKRKRPSGLVAAPPDKAPVVHLTEGDSEANIDHAATPKKIKTKASLKGQDEEKRLKIFRKKAPLSYLEKLERARGQR